MEKRISGHTGLLALIGSPVGHSGSPAMYNYSFEKLGLDYAYVAFDIKEDKVKDAIAALKTFNMRGCNVTMPDKVEAAKYMDELSPAAQIIGAISILPTVERLPKPAFCPAPVFPKPTKSQANLFRCHISRQQQRPKPE